MLLLTAVLALTALSGCFSEKVHYYTPGESLGIIFETGDEQQVVRCYITPREPSARETTHEVTEGEMTRLKNSCENIGQLHEQNRNRRAVINIIAPGTKWCGTGNTAKNDGSLGSKPVTDACCRAHDKCNPKIKGFGRKGTFINSLPWTRLHCNCDTAFYKCLKKARKTGGEKFTADMVGITYFNIFDSKCFKAHSYRICNKFGWFKCKGYKTIHTYKWSNNKKY